MSLSALAAPYQPFNYDAPSTAQEAAELEAVEAFVDELASLDLLEELEERAHGLNSEAAPFQPAFLDAQHAAELEVVEAFVGELANLSLLEEQEELARNP